MTTATVPLTQVAEEIGISVQDLLEVSQQIPVLKKLNLKTDSSVSETTKDRLVNAAQMVRNTVAALPASTDEITVLQTVDEETGLSKTELKAIAFNTKMSQQAISQLALKIAEADLQRAIKIGYQQRSHERDAYEMGAYLAAQEDLLARFQKSKDQESALKQQAEDFDLNEVAMKAFGITLQESLEQVKAIAEEFGDMGDNSLWQMAMNGLKKK